MPLRKLEDLFEKPVVRQYSAGQIILHQGDTLNSVYYVKKGYAKMYTITDDGEERDLLIFRPRTAFPIYPSLDRTPPTLKYFYQTVTDCQLLVVPYKQFNAIIKNNHEAGLLVLEYVNGLSGELINRVSITQNKDSLSKIKHLLEYYTRVCSKLIRPGIYKTQIRVTQQDIANMAGLTRETVSLQMQKLKDAGVIAQKNGHLVIRKRKLLKS